MILALTVDVSFGIAVSILLVNGTVLLSTDTGLASLIDAPLVNEPAGCAELTEDGFVVVAGVFALTALEFSLVFALELDPDDTLLELAGAVETLASVAEVTSFGAFT